jgi:hypothetical protein
MQKNLAIGKAGEYRVASELLLHGIEVFLSSVDSGTDMILSNGMRIQVKSANRVRQQRGSNCFEYAFSFKSWRKRNRRYEPHPLSGIDFVILWAIEDDSFFIIPRKELTGKVYIRFGVNKRKTSRYVPFLNNWTLLASVAT